MLQREYFGFNSIKNLKKILSKHNPATIFLVTGKNSYVNSGTKYILDNILNDYNVIHFNDFEINPKLSDIEKGLNIFKGEKCDLVIAVGGGSVIDVAKSINIFVSNPAEPIEYVKKKNYIKNKGKILIAIPTTAGSGSEATKFAVVYINKIKYSLEHDLMLPDHAIIDPQFTMKLPKNITASTGMDALSQAIESYWCINSTPKSKIYAKKAIKLIIFNLPIVVNKYSKEARKAMAMAANLAGKSINITKTTACHAISYPITSYFNVPHGHAVALTLAPILLYNSRVTEKDVLDKRGTNYVKKTIKEIANLIGAGNVKEASKKITILIKKIGLSTKLGELGIKSNEDIDLIIKNGFNPDRVSNNPRRLNKKALREILNSIK